MHPLLALALFVQAPAADTIQVREGLYVGFSIGPAMVGVSCDGCSPDSGSHFGGQLNGAIGVVASPHLTIGFQYNSWGTNESDDGISAGSLVATWYPSLGSGGFLRPSLGFASFRGTTTADGVSEKGSGMVAGFTIGTDLRVDKKLSFTPTLAFQYAGIGKSTFAGLPDRSGISAWMVGIGVGLTWH